MDDSTLMFVVIGVVAISVIGALLKTLFFGFVMKKGVEQYLRAFENARVEAQGLLSQAAREGKPLNLQTQGRFMETWTRMQGELQQLDAIRREQSELRMNDIKMQAASMGLYL